MPRKTNNSIRRPIETINHQKPTKKENLLMLSVCIQVYVWTISQRWKVVLDIHVDPISLP